MGFRSVEMLQKMHQECTLVDCKQFPSDCTNLILQTSFLLGCRRRIKENVNNVSCDLVKMGNSQYHAAHHYCMHHDEHLMMMMMMMNMMSYTCDHDYHDQ